MLQHFKLLPEILRDRLCCFIHCISEINQVKWFLQIRKATVPESLN
jgi:hypothetical protein